MPSNKHSELERRVAILEREIAELKKIIRKPVPELTKRNEMAEMVQVAQRSMNALEGAVRERTKRK
jgi:hypothetical protein